MEGKKPTKEQIELVQLVADGLTQAEISLKLGFKQRTVEDRLKKLRSTVGSKSTHRLCLEYYKQGWIT